MTKYWVSHPKFTGQVTVEGEDDRIIAVPPVWYRFLKQPFANLRKWLNGLGPGLKIQKL